MSHGDAGSLDMKQLDSGLCVADDSSDELPCVRTNENI
jgi:hypothetical protein